MTITIDVKNSGVLTLLRDMERLDLLHVTTHDAAVSPAPAASAKPEEREIGISNQDAEYLKRKTREAHDIELINRDAEWLNAEAQDVLSYQSLDL
jgi:hypothetical protein